MNKEIGWLSNEDSEFLAVLRSFSIFIIVFGHVGGFWFFPPWTQFLHVFVPVFFFISGAVAYNNYIKSLSKRIYLSKRVVGLLIPYYCVCFFALVVYVFLHKACPAFDLSNMIKWITISPNNSIMPFPLGQVWFLHTLLIISITSPALFVIYQKHKVVFMLLLCCSVVISILQLFMDVAQKLEVAGHNFYKPLVHLLFFSFGFMAIDNDKFSSKSTSIILSFLFFITTVLVVFGLKLNPDYRHHTYSPDFYYVSGSLCAIWFLLFIQKDVMSLYRRLPVFFHYVSEFFFKHTFAIYLLHSFAIFFAEEAFGLVNPQRKTFSYAIVKLTLVFLTTLLMSPLLTELVNKIQGKIVKLLVRN